MDGNDEAGKGSELALSLCVTELGSNILQSEHRENFLVSALDVVLCTMALCSPWSFLQFCLRSEGQLRKTPQQCLIWAFRMGGH